MAVMTVEMAAGLMAAMVMAAARDAETVGALEEASGRGSAGHFVRESRDGILQIS